MFSCAKCRGMELVRTKRGAGISWDCPKCSGKLFGVDVLRRRLPKPAFNSLWQAAVASPQTGVARCPSCSHPMRNFTTSASDSETSLSLDVCPSCYLIWFDDHELEQLPVSPVVEAKELSPALQEAVGKMEIELLRERAEREGTYLNEDWRSVPALFGLPVELNDEAVQQRPWVTHILGGVILMVSLLALFWQRGWIQQFGLIPSQVSRYAGVTFLTSFFLHGSLWHLLSNLYFLLIFGDNVEDYLGRLRYGLLLIAATVCGGAMEVAWHPHATIPLIGASGGISGIIAFYALSFPRAMIAVIPSFRLYVATGGKFWLRLPVMMAFGIWILIQLGGLYLESLQKTNVAHLAHLCGVGVGVIFWLAWRRTEQRPLR